MARVRVERQLHAVARADHRLAALGADQAEDQADERRLALAGRADQRDDLARARDHLRIPDHALAADIAKAHVAHLDGKAVVNIRVQLAAARHMRLARQIHQLADAVRGDRRIQERRDDADQAGKRAGELVALLHEERHRAVGDLPRPQAVEAVAEDDALQDKAEDRADHARLDGEHVVLELEVLDLLLPLAQLFAVMRRDAEGLDRVEIVERLHLEARHLAAHFLGALGVAAAVLHQDGRHGKAHRRADKRQHRHHFVITHDDEEGDDEIVHEDDDRREPADGVAGDRAHVAGKAVEQIAVGVLAHGVPVRVDDPVKDIRLDVVADVDAQLHVEAAKPVADGQVEDRGRHCHGHQHPELVRLVAGDHVQQVLAHQAAHDAERRADQAHDRRVHDRPLVLFAV